MCERERERERERAVKELPCFCSCVQVDPVTGMVMNIAELKKVIEVRQLICPVCVCVSSLFHVQESVMKQVDHKHLDKDVPFFKNHVR